MSRVMTVVPILAALALSGCMTVDGGSFNMLTTEQEVALGRECAAEVEKQEKLLDDPALQAYVRAIGDRVARVSFRQDVQYHFTVVDNPETVNAFALPGGHVYLYTGLLKICENEAELASVIAHEIGHVTGQHHGESMTRQYGVNLLMGMALGEDPGAVAELVASLVGTGFAMHYSREDEREADSLGMEFLFRAGYQPDAMLTFMNKLLAQERERGGGPPLPIFASHPPTEERLMRLQALLQRYPESMRAGSPVYAEKYQKEALARIR